MGIGDEYLFGKPEIVMNDYQAYLVLIGFISEQNVSEEEKFMVNQAAHQLYHKLKEMQNNERR